MSARRNVHIGVALIAVAYAAIFGQLVMFGLPTKTVVFHMSLLDKLQIIAFVTAAITSVIALVLASRAKQTVEPAMQGRRKAVFVMSIVALPLSPVVWFLNALGGVAFA